MAIETTKSGVTCKAMVECAGCGQSYEVTSKNVNPITVISVMSIADIAAAKGFEVKLLNGVYEYTCPNCVLVRKSGNTPTNEAL